MNIETNTPYYQREEDNQQSVQRETITTTPQKRISYLEIAKMKKTHLEAFPEPVQVKVMSSKAAMTSFVRPLPQRRIKFEAVYFGNAKRGPLQKLRALRISLPGEAILYLDFVGDRSSKGYSTSPRSPNYCPT